ncbi:hypothetical protein ABC855_g4638 [[Candida] zeylanoides]
MADPGRALAALDRILPAPTLYDHNSVRLETLENDLAVLLDWLDPCFPTGGALKDPSPRVRSAVRSCLRDTATQLEFVTLYCNSIAQRFGSADFDAPFLTVVSNIQRIDAYYAHHARFLGLGAEAQRRLDRHLRASFRARLTAPFLEALRAFLQASLFSKQLQPQVGQCIALLERVGLGDEVRAVVVELSVQQCQSFVRRTCSGVWSQQLGEINAWVAGELYQYFGLIEGDGAGGASGGTATENRGDTVASGSLGASLGSSPPARGYPRPQRLSAVRPGRPSSRPRALARPLAAAEAAAPPGLPSLLKIAHDELVALRISEIYALVRAYPASAPALRELHQCTTTNTLEAQTRQRHKLVTTFNALCAQRLLHSGADTTDIITYYSATIRSFLLIDPRGVLLDKVVRPIRRYLKTRPDVIPKVVEGLLDEDARSNRLIELAWELRAPPPASAARQGAAGDDYTLDWTPDPIDALPDFKKDKVTDIIESIVSIFESRSVFIKEFTTRFGRQLLALRDYNVDAVVQSLALLKPRFGDAEFASLDVMIRDVRHSRRVGQRLIASGDRAFVYHPKILSHMYWPQLEDATAQFEWPRRVREQQAAYFERYASSAAGRGRYLKSVPALGCVRLEIEVGGAVFAFEVGTAEATVVCLFESEALTAAQVCDCTGMGAALAARSLDAWVQRGVLRKTDGLYTAASAAADVTASVASPPVPRHSPRSLSAFAAAIDSDRFAASKTLSVVRGMLRNLGPLPFAKIASFLSVTSPDASPDLRELLDWCERRGHLTARDGLYSLPNTS